MKNPEGTDFWLCFQKNYRDPKNPGSSDLQLELFITGNDDANVEIEIKGIDFYEEFFVPGRTVKNVKIPPAAQLKNDGVIEQLAVHLTSDNPVSVYGLNRRFQTTDTYLGLPVKVLGTEYRAICYSKSNDYTPQFAVIASEDSTDVRITPSFNTTKHEEGVEFRVLLNKGEVYQVSAAKEKFSGCDLTGSLIKANKKIAVFSGHQCSYVPKNVIACNHLVEQLPPVPSWGKHFYLGKLKPRSNFTYRVLAHEPQTKVFENSKLVKILDAGDFYENIGYDHIQLTADKRVLVAQYSQGFRNGDSIGDPMMLLISPTQQFLQRYRFATPVNGFWKHNVNIVAPTKSINTIKLDDFPIDTSEFKPLGISRYSIAQIQVPYGSHSLEGAMPFGMYSYGFGYDDDAFDAYGTMGGQSFVEYEPSKDTLPPTAELGRQKKEYVGSIIFRDDHVDDSGIRDITILEQEGIVIDLPRFEEGILQLETKISPEKVNVPGRLVVHVSDVALNSAKYTLCYTYDRDLDKFVFKLNEGIVESCAIDPGILVGLFFKPSVNIHTADFNSSGNVSSKGTFTNATGFGGYGGIVASRKFRHDFGLSAKLSFETYNGILKAPDDALTQYRDDDGSLKSYQAARDIEINSLFLHFALDAEYYLESYMYLFGGLNLAFTLSDDINYSTRMIIPEGKTFENGERVITYPGDPTSMGSFTSLRFGMFAGAGWTYPLTDKITAFSEVMYTYHLNNVINDGDWKLQQLSILIGAKYKFSLK